MAALLTNKDVEPNLDVMRSVATDLEVELPDTDDLKKNVAAMRKVFKSRLKGVPKEDWVECTKCGEYTDDADELDCCPFCGDEGEDEGMIEASEIHEGADVVEPEAVDIYDDGGKQEVSKKNGKSALKLVKGGKVQKKKTNEDDSELSKLRDLIRDKTRDMALNAFDVGVAFKKVHDGELWSADYASFVAFVEDVGYKSAHAYSLMAITQQFTRKQVQEHGWSKLKIVAKLAEKSGKSVDEALTDSKGKSKRELQDELNPEKGGDTITLLAKVGTKAKRYKWRDKKTREEVQMWTPDTYVEIPLSEDVSAFVACVLNKDKVVTGLSVGFERAK